MDTIRNIFVYLMPVPVATRFKALVCGSSPAGVVGSNPVGGNGCLSLVSVVCLQVRCLCRADHSSRGGLPNVVCLSEIVKPR